MSELMLLLGMVGGGTLAIIAYRLGLNDRKVIDSGGTVQVSPIKAVSEAIAASEEKKAVVEAQNELDRLLDYDGFPKPKGVADGKK